MALVHVCVCVFSLCGVSGLNAVQAGRQPSCPYTEAETGFQVLSVGSHPVSFLLSSR